ncbi:MAG: hypothetical protein AAF126_18300 [Chloroflexota bacterium]
MANDDFMYSRQEQPRPQFISDLRQSLAEAESEPKLIARLWRPDSLFQRLASVAAVFLFFSAVFFSASPYARASFMQMVDNFIATNDRDAQATLPYDVPQVIPDGFSRIIYEVSYDEEGEPVLNLRDGHGNNDGEVVLGPFFYTETVVGIIRWYNEASNCHIHMIIMEDLTTPETRLASLERNLDFAARYDWIEVFPIGETDTRAVWRLTTAGVSTQPDSMTIEWTSPENIRHSMQTTVDCLSQEDFIAMAQSAE